MSTSLACAPMRSRLSSAFTDSVAAAVSVAPAKAGYSSSAAAAARTGQPAPVLRPNHLQCRDGPIRGVVAVGRVYMEPPDAVRTTGRAPGANRPGGASQK